MSTCSEVAGFLDKLGSTPMEVEATIEAIGLGGVPRSFCECPVARYLKTLGVRGVVVSRFHVMFIDDGGEKQVDGSVPLPLAVRAFTRAFDNGRKATLADLND